MLAQSLMKALTCPASHLRGVQLVAVFQLGCPNSCSHGDLSPALNCLPVPVEPWLLLAHGTRAHSGDQDLLMLQQHCLCETLLLLGHVVRDMSLPAELQRAGLALAVLSQLAALLGLACLQHCCLPVGWAGLSPC